MQSNILQYRVLKQLGERPGTTQRQLAGLTGVSLGTINSCLKALKEMGYIRVENMPDGGDKRRFVYLLTPAGIEARGRMTSLLLEEKMAEYQALLAEMEGLGTETQLSKTQEGRGTSSPRPFHLYHLGGETSVTGSCHLLQVKGVNILVDCGLTQGADRSLAVESWPVPPDKLDYLFLTHAHLDHIGRLPELIQQGFSGEILTTHATKALLGPMLRDSMALQHLNEDRLQEDLAEIDRLSWGFEYGKTFDLARGIRFSLGRAGHIMGSCFIRFEWDDPSCSVIFSGDLGGKDTPLLPDPDSPGPCDLLVLESTYGDRLHKDRTNRIKRLGEALNRALSDNGKVFIPAFALGRSQEIIYEIDRLFTSPTWSKKTARVPVFLDSPLGLEITEIYSSLSKYWDLEARELAVKGDHPLDFDNLYSVRNYRDHLKLVHSDGPCVIIAGSGMCTGGRIIDHLLTGLEDRRNDIFFVGYQAKGTQGRDILEYSSRPNGYVHLKGVRCEIRARVHALGGYSAHADQRGLIDWVRSMPEKPGAIKLVHGEPAAQTALGMTLGEMGYRVR